MDQVRFNHCDMIAFAEKMQIQNGSYMMLVFGFLTCSKTVSKIRSIQPVHSTLSTFPVQHQRIHFLHTMTNFKSLKIVSPFAIYSVLLDRVSHTPSERLCDLNRLPIAHGSILKTSWLWYKSSLYPVCPLFIFNLI